MQQGPLTEEGAEDLHELFSGLAEQAAFRIQKSLSQDAAVPAAVIHALVEQFEDTLIRSGTSVQEFRRFVRSYRNDLWPEEFQGTDEANSRFAHVVRVAQDISSVESRPKPLPHDQPGLDEEHRGTLRRPSP
ncbi:hypothetical protein ACWD01_34840 [Streptomyces sp. NPDC002835]